MKCSAKCSIASHRHVPSKRRGSNELPPFARMAHKFHLKDPAYNVPGNKSRGYIKIQCVDEDLACLLARGATQRSTTFR